MIQTRARAELLRPTTLARRQPISSNLGEKQRPVRIKLMDGESVRGWIEYYDRRMVRLTREGAPNLFIFKHEIAYIAEDTVRKPRAESPSAPHNGTPPGEAQ